MSNAIREKCRLLVAGGLLFVAGPALCADPPARALFVTGQVIAIHDGKERPLFKGADIEVGDEIRTGIASNIQIRFSDASLVSLKPETSFAVANYYFNGHDDGSERIFLNLLRGGLRTVTGIIGHTNHDSYKVITPTATIGIRGTVWGATYCAADECKNDDGTVAKPGTYGEVKSGAIGVANDTPEVVFGANTAFYVANRASPPERLLIAPHFVAVGLQTRATSSSSSSSSTSNFGASQAGTASVSSAAAVAAPPDTSGTGSASSGTTDNTQSVYVASNNTTPSGSSEVLAPTTTLTGVTGFIAVYTVGTSNADRVKTCYGCAQYGQNFSQPNQAVTSFAFQNTGQVTSWSSVTGPQALTQTAPLSSNSQVMTVDTGQVIAGQLVGNYSGVTTTGAPFSGPGGLVYLATNSPLAGVASMNSSSPSSGSFSFGGPGAFVGLAADAAGNSGTFSRFTASFNAGTGAYAFAAVANFASIGSYGPASFNLSGTASFTQQSGNSGDQILTASCTGSGCATPSPGGYWQGGFLNTATTIPATIVSGYLYNATKNTSSGNTLVFAGALKCVAGRC